MAAIEQATQPAEQYCRLWCWHVQIWYPQGRWQKTAVGGDASCRRSASVLTLWNSVRRPGMLVAVIGLGLTACRGTEGAQWRDRKAKPHTERLSAVQSNTLLSLIGMRSSLLSSSPVMGSLPVSCMRTTR